MKKLLLILLCLPMIGFGQEWQEIFEGGIGYSVQQTTDGGYIITGFLNTLNGDADVWLIKTNSMGDSLWSRTFGGIQSDKGYAVEQTTDGGYIITGETFSFGNTIFGNSDVWLIKTNSMGDSLWSRTFGDEEGDMCHSVQQTTDGGYIIGSYGENYLIKTDSYGDTIWTKGLMEGGWGTGYDVRQTTDGGYIIVGIGIVDIANPMVGRIVKTDSNGDSLWTKTLYELGAGAEVRQTTDGGYIITGVTNLNDSISDNDVYLIKTDGNGDSLWTKTFGGTGSDYGESVQQTTDGGYIITGYTISSGNPNIYLIRADGNGDALWTKTFGGLGFALGYSVQQTTDGGYIITGTTSATTTSIGGIYLIKTDSQGNITSTFNIPINPNRKLQKTVDLLGKETKPQTNTPLIEIYDDGTVEKRIVIE